MRRRRRRRTRDKGSMKLTMPSFFASPSKKKRSKESISYRNASYGSNASSSSDDSSSSSFRPHASPRSVLLPLSAHDLLPNFDAKISARELEAVLRWLGPDQNAVDPTAAPDGEITEAEIEAVGAALDPAEADLREAFAVFDADGDGKISAEELLGVFVTLGDCCTLEDCRRMIHGVDSDGDGFVCFNDFARMMVGR